MSNAQTLRWSRPARRPRGTREYPLTAASFRTWRGSRAPAARDPTGRIHRRLFRNPTPSPGLWKAGESAFWWGWTAWRI